MDLSRIPEQYRERVRREADEAWSKQRSDTTAAGYPGSAKWAADCARDGVLAKYHAIADEANAVYLAWPNPNEAPAARDDVWARHMAPAQGDYERGVADERRRTLAFLRREEEKHAKAAVLSDLGSVARDRCSVRAAILRTILAYLERGDHETEET